MVKFYEVIVKETCRELVFVIKLDECELLNQKKSNNNLDRALNTIRNQEDPIPNEEGPTDKGHPSFFSVQSENNIWWLGNFQVYIFIYIYIYRKNCLKINNQMLLLLGS